MYFVKHPNHTGYMGAPRDWNERRDGPCGALSIHDRRNEQTPKMESCWLPEGTEALCLALGLADIRLGILGHTHPPVYLSVMPKAFNSGETLQQHAQTAFATVLGQLRDMAKAYRLDLKLVDGEIVVEGETK